MEVSSFGGWKLLLSFGEKNIFGKKNNQNVFVFECFRFFWGECFGISNVLVFLFRFWGLALFFGVFALYAGGFSVCGKSLKFIFSSFHGGLSV